MLRQHAVPEHVYLLSDGIAKFERVESGRSRAIVGLRFPGWFLGAESGPAGVLDVQPLQTGSPSGGPPSRARLATGSCSKPEATAP